MADCISSQIRAGWLLADSPSSRTFSTMGISSRDARHAAGLSRKRSCSAATRRVSYASPPFGSGPCKTATLAAIVCAIHAGDAAITSNSMVFETTYVGLPLAVAFAQAGEQVVAVDIDEGRVAAIKAGESYIEDIPSEQLRAVLPSLEPSTHFAPLARTDAVLICVPTPLTANREPDLGP